jgi:hypothetical protein
MQRDAKFGLIFGIVLVLVIAVVFSRQEPTSASQPDASFTKIAAGSAANR